MVRHFGTSRRAAARAEAAQHDAEPQPLDATVRRYRYVVHLREHTLIVPMVSTATVAALTAEVQARSAKRQLVSGTIIDVQVRTDNGTGFLDASDILGDVVTETDELVAVVDGSAPLKLAATLPKAREVLKHRPQPIVPSSPWAASIVRIDAVAAPAPSAAGSSPQRPRSSGGSSTKPPNARRASAITPASVASEAEGELADKQPLNIAGRQREYLEHLLTDLHRHEAAGVPPYKARIVDQLHSRSMHDSAATRPLLQRPLSKRTLRAQLDDFAHAGAHAASSFGTDPLLPPIGSAPRGSLAATAPAGALGARAAPERSERSSAELLEERERRLYSFQNALSKLELDALELQDREERLRDEADSADAEAAQVRADTQFTPLELQDKHAKHRSNTTGRLKRAELRVSESHVNNGQLKGRINHLRKELSIFVKTLGRVRERDDAISRDVHLITAGIHSIMDDRQKVRGRIERLQHEYRAETRLYSKQLARTSAELNELEGTRQARTQQLELALDADKRREYVRLSRARLGARERELKAGRLQDHLDWFQQQAVQIEGLIDAKRRFRPEEPGGARDTIAHFEEAENKAKSLWNRIDDNENQAVELTREIRALSARVHALEASASVRQAAHDDARYSAHKLDEAAPDEFVTASLEGLLQPVGSLFELLECELATDGDDDAPAAALSVHTIALHFDVVERALRRKQQRARQVYQLRKQLAVQRAVALGYVSPRSLALAEAAGGFHPETSSVLEPFQHMYDVAYIPYDLGETLADLAAEVSKLELQAELDLRSTSKLHDELM